MHRLCDEPKEQLVRTIPKTKTLVREDPHVIPVKIGDPVLPDVTSGVVEPWVRAWQPTQVVQPRQELYLVEIALQGDPSERLNDLPSREAGDRDLFRFRGVHCIPDS